MNEIHYEVFVRRGKKGGWALLEAIIDRTAAIARAQEVLGQGGVIAVKVTKETFKPEDGTFQSVSVFQEGAPDKASKEEVKPYVPCFKPQDLFTRHARGLIGRVLASTLDEWQLVPMELIHRGDVLEKLEARSTVLQHAVQQVAVVQAANSPGALHEIFRQLMDLSLRAMDMVVKDERRGRFKPLEGTSVAAFWRAQGAQGDAAYLLAAAIALYLKNANGWAAKLRFLLELLADVPEEEEAKRACLATIDSFVAEMIRSPASLSDLIGECADLGEALKVMIAVFLGRDAPDAENRPQSLARLSFAFKHNMLDEARSALIDRIMGEIRSFARLHPDSFEQELHSMRFLAQQLVSGIGPHLSHETITEVFAVRSKRLVTPESIEAYLATAVTVDDRIRKLIDLEENVVGAQSKKAVAGFLSPILAAPKAEMQIGGERAPVTAKLRTVAELQRTISSSHFDEMDQADILKALDLLAMRIAERFQFFRSIEQRPVPLAEKTLALLRLMARQMIPEGDCMTKARALAQAMTRKNDFMATLMPADMPADQRQERLAEFRSLWELAGLAKERSDIAPAASAESAA